jgi:hypothetical protein
MKRSSIESRENSTVIEIRSEIIRSSRSRFVASRSVLALCHISY